MESHTCLTLVFFVLVNLAVGVLSTDNYSRHDFPVDFVFGSGTSAYQVEGAANEDGRTPSIWDTFAHAGFARGGNGDVACDTYHKYKEDVQLMVETGLDAYRFSISWSRLIPNGRGPVNPKGLQYYNNLINELIRNGIQPHVTLHNYDLPQALEDEYEGWLSRQVIKDFTNYADVCFREFGDRVKYWTTVNEPNIFAVGSYDQGISPPKRCSPPFCVIESTKGNSTFEPYLVVHHILLAHSSAVRLYRRKYREEQNGFVGISIYAFGSVPQTNTEKDRAACQRFHDFYLGWIMEPLLHGDYPDSMKANAGARIPSFTSRESEQVKGSYDFIGIIHYIKLNVTDNSDVLKTELRDFIADSAAKPLGTEDIFVANEYPFTPWALGEVLETFKTLYGNPPIFIHENGQRTLSNASLHHDESRVKYLHGYIGTVLDSLRNGSNMKGYFAWSFIDAFELLDGYESIYGLYYVDRNDPELRRYPKLSAKWYSQFLKGTRSSLVGAIELNNDSSLVSVGHLLQ
ncbi:putative hydroxyisourate hydrolase [Medicago truncatula]|uniref:Glycoside hydrolase family 1 protein n=1 Tax=Medicago truncatula TaxID=3880 RepID=G7K666_MEDTR|nr:hydroxyisourate hydrolase isoform X2 [Medicago truncatula]AES98450.1 glycoside hydrolase family 1 protein [Medicago truncatula]RHN56376.1 putative hydroxyisourate hydrolase [Medicago truncatula]